MKNAAESLLQEWLRFGVSHEFKMACGLGMNVASFIWASTAGNSRILNSEPLIGHM